MNVIKVIEITHTKMIYILSESIIKQQFVEESEALVTDGSTSRLSVT